MAQNTISRIESEEGRYYVKTLGSGTVLAAATAQAAPSPHVASPAPAATPAAKSASAFAGSWLGRWKEGPRGTLTIQDISDGGAELVYNVETPKRRTLSSVDRTHGRSRLTVEEGGVMRATLANGARVTFRLSEDGTAFDSEYVRDDARYVGRFTRLQAP